MSASRPSITDAERRARLVARHHLGRTALNVEAAVRGVVAAHSSDPVTPHLAMWARVPTMTTSDLEHALLTTKSLWRLHAMRRTLFVVATDEAPMFQAAAARDIADKERRRVESWVAPEIRARSVPRWLAKLEARILEALEGAGELRTQQLSDAISELATPITLGSGKWSTRAPLSSRLLFVMAMDGRIVRTRPTGSWRSSQYHWAATEAWFGGARPALDQRAARAALTRRYLATHGPATTIDVQWWTGWTKRRTTAALAEVEAQAVALAGGAEAWVLPDDHAPVKAEGARVALLPGLDPTPMGWKERDFYLGPHAGRLFDKNGNVGPTVWLDGRIVGGWAQRPDGEVVHLLLEDVGKRAAALVAREAASLTAWLDGVTTIPRFRTPLERELSDAG